MLPLIAACSPATQVRDVGCPVPGFLWPVKPVPLKEGADLGAAVNARSGELRTANKRITEARAYIAGTCNQRPVK